MISLSADIGYRSLTKHGELLCGDSVAVAEREDGNSVVIVLADGLGSGVKANILSTLTTTIISTMMAGGMSLEECVQAIVATLPVCETREIAYSTFTIISVGADLRAELIQYDNPHVVFLRDGKNVEYEKSSAEVGGKRIYTSKLKLIEDDVFVAVSDGVVHAGVGRSLNFGWTREELIWFLEESYSPDSNARAITASVLRRCNELYEYMPGDDTTVCTLKIRRPSLVSLMIGPPSNPENDEQVLEMFFRENGKRIVCGGTTSSLAANYLGEKLHLGFEYIDPQIPPTGKIQGVDLVTEGVITINRVLTYAKDYLESGKFYDVWHCSNDGASLITRMLIEEATEINFYVGKAINPAHQNPDLPIDFSIKMRLVEELVETLRRMGKRIKTAFF